MKKNKVNTKEFFSTHSEAIKRVGMLDLNMSFCSTHSETIKRVGMLDLKPAGGFKWQNIK